jgi:hypothetical protein
MPAPCSSPAGATACRRALVLWALGLGGAPLARAAEAPEAHSHAEDTDPHVIADESALLAALLPRAPRIAAAEAELRAAQQGALAADTRPDLMVEVGLQNLPTATLRLRDEEMGGLMVGLVAPIEPRGSLDARRQSAAAATGTAAAERALTVTLESRALRRGYWSAVAPAVEAAHMREEQAQLQELWPVVEGRYAAGLEPAGSLPALRLAIASLNDGAAALEAEAAASTAPLSARFGSPLRLRVPEALPARPPPSPAPTCARPEAVDPMIDVLDAIFAQEQAEAAAARVGGRPGLQLSAGLMRRSPGAVAAAHSPMSPTLISVGAAVPLTFGAQRRARAEEGAALQRGAAAAADRRALAEEACGIIAGGGLRWVEAGARAQRIEVEQLPAALELEALAWARYRSGDGPLEAALRAAAERHGLERALHGARFEAILWSIDLQDLQLDGAP